MWLRIVGFAPEIHCKLAQDNISSTIRQMRRSEVLNECRRAINHFRHVERSYYGAEVPMEAAAVRQSEHPYDRRLVTIPSPAHMPVLLSQSSDMNLLRTIEETRPGDDDKTPGLPSPVGGENLLRPFSKVCDAGPGSAAYHWTMFFVCCRYASASRFTCH
jgi:hypothetical protein